MKPIVVSTYGQKLEFDLEKSTEIYIDLFPSGIKTTDYRILIVMEPEVVSRLSKKVIERKKEFDFIFTYDSEILESCENSVLFELGTSWVDYEKYTYPDKDFKISTVCGHKDLSKNHRLRKKVWYNQEKIKNPTDFYISQYGGVDNVNENKILGESKLPLFESMFHICIENDVKKYYFTEKLIDTLLCKSVPIYVGCENIEEYFNINGFIVVSSFNELIEKCNSLTEKDYFDRICFIEENFEKAIFWSNFPKRVENKLKELI